MGLTKYKANSRIGRKLLAAGRDLTQHPPTEANTEDFSDHPNVQELLSHPPFTLGEAVLVLTLDVAGVVRWIGPDKFKPTLRIGVSVQGRDDLLFCGLSELKKIT